MGSGEGQYKSIKDENIKYVRENGRIKVRNKN